MKFEANIPSYLRTGQGVFPVKSTAASKAEKETNFFKLMKKGMEMPVSNDKDTPEFAPIGDITPKQPMNEENFLDKMQKNMEEPTTTSPRFDTRPVMPQVKPQILKEPDQMEVKADDADIFIG